MVMVDVDNVRLAHYWKMGLCHVCCRPKWDTSTYGGCLMRAGSPCPSSALATGGPQSLRPQPLESQHSCKAEFVFFQLIRHEFSHDQQSMARFVGVIDFHRSQCMPYCSCGKYFENPLVFYISTLTWKHHRLYIPSCVTVSHSWSINLSCHL